MEQTVIVALFLVWILRVYQCIEQKHENIDAMQQNEDLPSALLPQDKMWTNRMANPMFRNITMQIIIVFGPWNKKCLLVFFVSRIILCSKNCTRGMTEKNHILNPLKIPKNFICTLWCIPILIERGKVTYAQIRANVLHITALISELPCKHHFSTII